MKLSEQEVLTSTGYMNAS